MVLLCRHDAFMKRLYQMDSSVPSADRAFVSGPGAKLDTKCTLSVNDLHPSLTSVCGILVTRGRCAATDISTDDKLMVIFNILI